ncbi:MAG TPA: NAD-dependent epimerase/dehydratase family protein [Actinomycetota bacterium]|nr:NAD-dependent epimerase/dehydratase family protein [Actinomycetota bacterium]
MRVLVTGGAGFIGSALVDRLVEAGDDVVVVDALLPQAHRGLPPYLNPGADYRWANVGDGKVVRAALAGVDAVCHLASMVGLGVDLGDAPGYVRENDLATAVLLAGLAGRGFGGRLVLAGSMVVYGEGGYRCADHGRVRPAPRSAGRLRAGRFDPSCPDCGADLEPEAVPESTAPDPRSVYAATKLHQEHLCACAARERGFPLTVLRYHNVYGPRMPAGTPYAGVAAIFRSALAEGTAPRIFEDGAQLRDFVHVDDVARATELAVHDSSATSHLCNIASGSPATVLDMATALSDAAGPSAPPPEVTGQFRLGDVRHVFASTVRAERVLGFRALIGLAEGMRRFAAEGLR